VRARAAEAEAQAEAATATEVSDFLVGLFQAGDPGAEGRDNVLAREILDRGVEAVDTELAGQQDIQGRLLYTMAQAYQGLALRVQAADLAERSLTAREAALGPTHPRLVDHLALAAELRARASDNPEETARTDPQILEWAERIREIGLIHEADDPDLYVRTVGAWAYWMQARGRMPEAESLLRADLDRLGSRSVETERNLLRLLGNMLMNDGQRAEAAEAWEAELALVPDDDVDARSVLTNNLAMAYGALGREDEAIEMFERNLEMERARSESDTDLRLHDALWNLSAQYREVGMWTEAADAYARLAAVQDAAWGTTTPYVPHTLSSEAHALLEAGEFDRADSVAALADRRIQPFLSDERFGSEVQATWAQIAGLRVAIARRSGRPGGLEEVLGALPADPARRWEAAMSLGWSLQAAGAPRDAARALDASEAALVEMASTDPDTPVFMARDTYWGLAHQALETDDAERLRDVAGRWVTTMSLLDGDGSGEHVLAARRESARVLAIGDPFQEIPPIEATRPDAVPVLEAILADRRGDLGGDDPGLLMHIAPLVLVHDGLGNADEAASWRADADRVVRAARARLEADGVEDSPAWNTICWWGALAGVPDSAMPACERAIELASDENLAGHRDSRGLARALVGDTAGALEDFRAYVEARPAGHEVAGVRRDWIAAFEVGRDPLDFLTLADIAM